MQPIFSRSDRNIDAVLFDWGGTLAEYLDNLPRDCLFLAADDLLPRPLSGMFADAVALRIEKSWSAGTTVPDTIESLTAEVIADIAEPALTGTIGAYFVKRYLSILAGVVRHHDMAKSLLVQLNRDGYRTALVCNTIWPAAWHDQLLGLR